MITEHDLREAIAECEGVRDPTANTCIKLAAYYTLLDHLADEPSSYSYASEPPNTTPSYTSGTDFGQIVQGMSMRDVLAVMDEAMSVIQGLHPRLYRAVMEKLAEKKGV